MAKNTEELNQIVGARVRQIRKEQNLTQEALAELIGLQAARHISMIERGDRALTRIRAEKIVQAFPQYRLQWLMGYDNYQTEVEAALFPVALNKIQQEEAQARRISAIVNLAYNVNHTRFIPNKDGITLTQDEIPRVRIGYSEYMEFEEEIEAFVEFKIQRLIQKGDINNG